MSLPPPPQERLTVAVATAEPTCPPEPWLWAQADGRLQESDRAESRRLAAHTRHCRKCAAALRERRRRFALVVHLSRPWRLLPLRLRLLLAVALAAATVPPPVDRSGGLAWQRCPLDGHWYARTAAADSWAQARRLAQAAGGDLVVVRSGQQNTWLAQHVADIKTFGLFIGLREVGTAGNWEWVDGSPVQFTRWNSGEPSDDTRGPHDAAAMYGLWDKPHGSWNDTPAEPRPSQGPAERCTAGLAERLTDPWPGRWRTPAVRLTGGVLSGLLLLNSLVVWRRRRAFRRTGHLGSTRGPERRGD